MENLTVYETEKDLTVARPPDVVLKEAMQAAKALGDVVSKKKKPVIMNGEQYLEFEDWQTVGRFYGITAKVISTAFIDYGNAQGFEAKAVAIRSDGMEISAAEAMCLNDEEKWSTRPKYEYPDGKKTKVGDVPVPLFQLKSMAQTRACAKALRNVLAWVVVLAGYKPTPAEEMTGREGDKPPLQGPQKTKTGDTPPLVITVKSVTKREKKADGTAMKSPLYVITSDAGVEFKTFSETFATMASKEKGTSTALNVEFASDKLGNTVKNMSYVEQPPEDAPEPGAEG
jgi:hypothetical protein